MGMTDKKRALKGGPRQPDLSTLPIRVPRDTAAELVTRFYFKVSPRSLERWPLAWRRLNGRAHCETAQLFDVAERMLAAAAPVMGGRRTEDQDKL